MVTHTFQDVKNGIDFLILVVSDDLEGSEQFSSEELELLFTSEMLDGNIDSSGLV